MSVGLATTWLMGISFGALQDLSNIISYAKFGFNWLRRFKFTQTKTTGFNHRKA